jgi:hypothetical protein
VFLDRALDIRRYWWAAIVDDERRLEQHHSTHLAPEAVRCVKSEHRSRRAAEQRRRSPSLVDECVDVLDLTSHRVGRRVATLATTSSVVVGHREPLSQVSSQSSGVGTVGERR